MDPLAEKRMSSLDEDDNLRFDDDVPHVIAARFRVARTLITAYAGDVELYEVEGLPAPHLRWLITFYIGDLGLSIPIPVSQAEDFHACVRPVHEILESLFKKGLRLSDILSGNGADVSVPVKGILTSDLDGL